jgi:transcriptional regulator with XRE-family HTH domain
MDWLKERVDRDPQVRKMADEMLNEMRLEEDLAMLREERGMSQSQLAKILGVSQPAIAKIESGKVKNLELKTLVRYTTALGGQVKVIIDKNLPGSQLAALRSSLK